MTHIQLFCNYCKKQFARKVSQISSNNYCSRSCAAIVNNKKFPKRPIEDKICPNCNKTFHSYINKKYCSKLCKDQGSQITKDAILQELKLFFKENNRIPLKREYLHVSAARRRFGTWNKAIKAAGFEANKVKFSKRYKAKDGHICDSFSEKIIDDWLSKQNVPHERNIPYNFHNMTADFKVNNTLIEFIGLQGVKAYDENLKQKELFLEANKIDVIKIYPKDLYPENNLSQLLQPVIMTL